MTQKSHLRLLLIFSALSFLTGFISTTSPDVADQTMKVFSEAAQSQIAQAGFFFTVAAWLHAGRVKKEIRDNFSALTESINKVADAFREDLKVQVSRLDNLATRVQSLEDTTKKEA